LAAICAKKSVRDAASGCFASPSATFYVRITL
jgi:hypothetical protein